MGKVPWESDPGLTQLRQTLSQLLFFGRKLLVEFQKQVQANTRLQSKIRKLERTRNPVHRTKLRKSNSKFLKKSSMKSSSHDSSSEPRRISPKAVGRPKGAVADIGRKGKGDSTQDDLRSQSRNESAATTSFTQKRRRPHQNAEMPKIFAIPLQTSASAPACSIRLDDTAFVEALTLLDTSHPLHGLIGRMHAVLKRQEDSKRNLKAELDAANARYDDVERKRADLATHLQLLRTVYYRFVSSNRDSVGDERYPCVVELPV